MSTSPLSHDLAYILEHTLPIWEDLRGQSIFVTGGTGFFGCWLLESFLYANEQLNLSAHLTVLTRHPRQFLKKYPHFAKHSAVSFLEGDVRNFRYPQGEFSHVIHAATEATATLNATNPLLMFDTITTGTKRVLDFAIQAQTKKCLLISSGAVYGVQPWDISHLDEAHPTQPVLQHPGSAYAVGKCVAEHLATLYASQYDLPVKIARGFAFVGPYLPLDANFAIGNFIQHYLNAETIQINGDGTPYRSYLYAADLAIWLWTILINGEIAKPYNVGSDHAISIAELAQLIANFSSPAMKVELATLPTPNEPPTRYVPSITCAMNRFHFPNPISLTDAITRTIRWHQQNVITT